MLAVDVAIYDRLASSVPLMNLVGNYRDTKAIFTVTPLPPGVVPPFIVVPAPVDDSPGPFDTKTTTGRRWVRDIGCYTRADGDPSTVEAMAEMVRSLFFVQHGSVDIEGFGTMIIECSGPVQAPTDDTMYGRMVTVTISAVAAN